MSRSGATPVTRRPLPSFHPFRFAHTTAISASSLCIANGIIVGAVSVIAFKEVRVFRSACQLRLRMLTMLAFQLVYDPVIRPRVPRFHKWCDMLQHVCMYAACFDNDPVRTITVFPQATIRSSDLDLDTVFGSIVRRCR